MARPAILPFLWTSHCLSPDLVNLLSQHLHPVSKAQLTSSVFVEHMFFNIDVYSKVFFCICLVLGMSILYSNYLVTCQLCVYGYSLAW